MILKKTFYSLVVLSKLIRKKEFVCQNCVKASVCIQAFMDFKSPYPLLICTLILKNQVVEIKFDELDF